MSSARRRERAGVVGPRVRDARRDHVRVADRLDLLEAVALGERVELAEQSIEQPDDLGRRQAVRSRREVDDVGEQHRRRRELVGDRLRARPSAARRSSPGGCSAAGSRPAPARSAAPTSASSRCFANSASSVNTIVPPTVMFSASIRLENHSGSGDSAAEEDRRDAGAEEERPATATNQRMPEPTPRKTSAPSGARMPHRPTPPVGSKPPIGDHRQRRRQGDGQQLDVQQQAEVPRPGEEGDRRDRDRRRRAAATQPVHAPNARYRTAQIPEIGRIRIAMRTRSAFRSRVSSSSPGSAPTSASRASAESSSRRSVVTSRG